MTISRRLQRQAERLADQQSDRLQNLPRDRRVIATVSTVTAGGAQNGRDLVSVTLGGQEVTCAGYADGYEWSAGQRVVCDLIGQQLLVDYPIVGQP